MARDKTVPFPWPIFLPVFKLPQDHVNDVNIICDGFWQAYEQTMKVVEAQRLRRLEEREKLVEQGRANQQHEINECHCQIGEHDCQLGECDRQIVKMQAELELLKAQPAALKDTAESPSP